MGTDLDAGAIVMAPLGYRPGLDGIRGVAILLVLGYNLEGFFKTGGYYGVDLFFGLSGFLITTLLYEWSASGRKPVYGEFLTRRARRLLPGLVIFLLGVVVSSLLLHERSKAIQNALQSLFALVFLSNWAVIANWVKPGAVSHLWSLCVEVHFYLIWGWLCTRLLRDGPGAARRILHWSLGLTVVFLLWRVAACAYGTHWLRLYLGTDTRLDGLFIGACFAALRLEVLRGTAGAVISGMHQGLSGAFAGGIAVAVIVAQVCLSDVKGRYPYLFGMPLASAATCVVILNILRDPPQSWIHRCLTLPPLVALGKLSYSLYLWHLPVGAMLSVERLGMKGIAMPWALFIQVTACLLVSVVSYRWIELRFSRGPGVRTGV